MKITLKHQTTVYDSAYCSVTEYNLNDELLDVAIAKISGRYPETRRVVNTQCNELAYVFEGKGKIVVNDVEHHLSTGDALIIETGEKYFWEGEMQLFLSCRPAWNKEQHQIVD